MYLKVIDSANRINNIFVESVNKLCSHLQTPTSSELSDAKKEHLFSISPVTIDAIQQVTDSLPNSATEGFDDISVVMLKKSPIAVFQALQQIFKISVSLRIFLSAWKQAIVAPIHKKGVIVGPNNYRPISSLSVISKVFEKLVYNQLRDYLDTEGIIHISQQGFHKKRSCKTTLLQQAKTLFTSHATKNYMYVTALDFNRAFDTI